MPRPNPEARQRLVATAADMLRRRGMNATSIRELAKAAKAPLGSTYHYFPGGKQQVVKEAVVFARNHVTDLLQPALEKGGATQGLKVFVEQWRETLTASDFNAGCPVMAVSIEEVITDDMQEAQTTAADAFQHWCSLLENQLINDGLSKKKAKSLAVLMVTSVEGAIAMCRVNRSVKTLDLVYAELRQLLNEKLENT